MDVFDVVLHAIDAWLKDITIKENQLKIIERKRNILQSRIEWSVLAHCAGVL